MQKNSYFRQSMKKEIKMISNVDVENRNLFYNPFCSFGFDFDQEEE